MKMLEGIRFCVRRTPMTAPRCLRGNGPSEAEQTFTNVVTLRLFATPGFPSSQARNGTACAVLRSLPSLRSIRAAHDGSALLKETVSDRQRKALCWSFGASHSTTGARSQDTRSIPFRCRSTVPSFNACTPRGCAWPALLSWQACIVGPAMSYDCQHSGSGKRALGASAHPNAGWGDGALSYPAPPVKNGGP